MEERIEIGFGHTRELGMVLAVGRYTYSRSTLFSFFSLFLLFFFFDIYMLLTRVVVSSVDEMVFRTPILISCLLLVTISSWFENQFITQSRMKFSSFLFSLYFFRLNVNMCNMKSWNVEWYVSKHMKDKHLTLPFFSISSSSPCWLSRVTAVSR